MLELVRGDGLELEAFEAKSLGAGCAGGDYRAIVSVPSDFSWDIVTHKD